jgi:beta-lactamase regulating signal transducer with metallopeptidase domain
VNELLSYIIKLSIGLSVVYVFYLLVLRRLTFYTWNRWYLLLFTLLAFVLPVIDLSPLLQQHALNNNPVVEMIPVVSGYTPHDVQVAPIVDHTWSIDKIILVFLAAGTGGMLVRLLLQYRSLYRIRRSARLLVNDGIKIYQVNQPIIPFSFGNAIYLNQQLHSDDELKDIVRHEFIHVKQKHSADMIWGELLCIVCWYNPFAWLTRMAIRQNLEFIADNQVLQTGIDRKQYQYLLLKVVGISSFSIASNFNFSSLKKRIAMMNKTKSARVNLIRFLCMLPLVLVVLLGFRTIIPAREQVQQIPVTDTVPAKAKTARPGLPPNVRSISIRDNGATVTLKNGKVEKYRLDNEEEWEAFENKYGKVPEPPVPPAAPAPGVAMAAPAPVTAPHAAAPGVPPVPVASTHAGQTPAPGAPARISTTPVPSPAPVAPQAPGMPVPPPPAPPYKMPKGVQRFHIDNNKATVILKNGKEETYDLNDPEEKAAFEKKFGKFNDEPGAPAAAVMPVPSSISTAERSREAHASASVTVDGAPAKVTNTSASSNDVMIVQASGSEVNSVQLTSRDDEGPQAEAGNGHPSEVLVFTPDLTADQLNQLKKDLDEKGFTLRLDDVHHKDGKLVAIKGVISRGNRKGIFDAKNFNKVVISFKRGVGFRLNMLEKGHISFNN